jgi:hypothetical protein
MFTTRGYFLLEVVSTGLRYLIVPIEEGLERARIVGADFEELYCEPSMPAELVDFEIQCRSEFSPPAQRNFEPGIQAAPSLTTLEIAPPVRSVITLTVFVRSRKVQTPRFPGL